MKKKMFDKVLHQDKTSIKLILNPMESSIVK
jgi:hypothetical protein